MFTELCGAAVLMEEAPEMELRGGLFFVTFHVGSSTIVSCWPPNVFFAAFRKAAEQCAEWRSKQSGEIVRIDAWRDHLCKH